MGFNLKEFIKNFSYTVSSNLLSLLISTLVVLVVPRLIGVSEYGYWQLYLFYASYVGFLHFGLSDGIYLREGGKRYEDLDKEKMFGQFFILTMMQLIIASAILLSARVFIQDSSRLVIINYIAVTTVITNIRSLPNFILQATNRIKEYAHITIIDRVIYFTLILLALLSGIRNFETLILADIIGRFFSLLLSIYYCRDLVIRPVSELKLSFKESFSNISIGIKLMLAYIASLLIIGVIRFGIEQVWDVETFGKISLTLSASNLMMLFINAVGLIMFPVLRRTDKNRLKDIYINVRDLIMVVLLGLLIFYYPLKAFLVMWLPDYAESLLYMALVFPMFIYEGKTALLINTYMKTLRMEKIMLRVNTVTMILSLVLTFLTAYVFNNLEMTVILIVLLLAFKSTFAEIILTKHLNIKIINDVIWEIGITLTFIFSGWYINNWATPVIYGLVYVIYVFYKRQGITRTINIFKDRLSLISN